MGAGVALGVEAQCGEGAFEVGDFFGAFVDEQAEDGDVGVVECDGAGDVFEERGFAGLGWGDDEGALTFAERAEEIDEAAGVWATGVFEGEAGLRVDGGEFVEGLDDGGCGGVEGGDGGRFGRGGSVGRVSAVVLVGLGLLVVAVWAAAVTGASGSHGGPCEGWGSDGQYFIRVDEGESRRVYASEASRGTAGRMRGGAKS